MDTPQDENIFLWMANGILTSRKEERQWELLGDVDGRMATKSYVSATDYFMSDVEFTSDLLKLYKALQEKASTSVDVAVCPSSPSLG